MNCRRLIDHRIDDQGTVSLFKVWFFNLVHGQDGRGMVFSQELANVGLQFRLHQGDHTRGTVSCILFNHGAIKHRKHVL